MKQCRRLLEKDMGLEEKELDKCKDVVTKEVDKVRPIFDLLQDSVLTTVPFIGLRGMDTSCMRCKLEMYVPHVLDIVESGCASTQAEYH